MRLHFVQGARPLTKTLGPNIRIGDFLPKRLTSTTVEVETSLPALCETLNAHIEMGLIKGNLTQELVNESRAGKVDRSSPTQLLILDVDGAPYSSHQDLMTHMELGDYQYLWKPSASYGVLDQFNTPIKQGLRGHIYMLISQNVGPEQMKAYIRHLNLTFFRPHLTLSPTTHSITWILDPCMVEPSRLLFLSPPVVQEPWSDSLEGNRQFEHIQEGRSLTVLPASLFTSQAVLNSATAQAEMFKDLRTARGLSSRKRFARHQVLRNPEPNTITFVGEARGYCYYNIGAGDSASYYHPSDDPEVMFTFKDEPPFLFEKMDQAAYMDAIRRAQLRHREESGHNYRYLVFRDYKTDVHYTGRWDVDNDKVQVWPTSKMNLEDFMRANTTPMPEPIPQLELVFRPDLPFAVETAQTGALQRINSYCHSEYDRLPPLAENVPPDFNYQNINMLTNRRFSAIHSLIFHVLGDDPVCTAWVLNWLAFCVQTRRKPQTALVIAGAPGTGKDTMIDHIFAPCFGESQYVFRTTLQDLASQYNRWASSSRLVVVSEARQSDLKGEKFAILSNNLKEWITNPVIAVRAMYRDTAQIQNFSAFVLLSNYYDVLRIGDGDRRFTVPPRQTVSLVDRQYPLDGRFDFATDKDLAYQQLVREIDQQMPDFIRFLKAYEVNQHAVTTPIENEAKVQMMSASLTTFESFLDRVLAGDLDFFADYLDRDPIVDTASSGTNVSILTLRNALQILLGHALQTLGQPCTMTRDQLLLLWCAVSNQQMEDQSPSLFSKRLVRNGVVLLPGGNVLGSDDPRRRARGIQVIWNITEYSPDVLLDLIRRPAIGAGTNATH